MYSLSSSSRTVQLYSRSRLLLLPLINLLSIFPPARRRERRGGAADPGPGAPQPGSSAPAPGTCTITPAQSPPLPPAGPAPPLLLLLLRHRLPQPRASTALSPRRPKAGAQLVGRGLGRRGPNGGQRGGTEWQTVQPIEIVHWEDGQLGEAITGKQSDLAKPDQPSGVPNEGLFYSLRFLQMLFPLPRVRCGHSAGSTSAAAWNTFGFCFRAKSYTLQRRGSRPLRSQRGKRSQSLHLQNAGTFCFGPGGCPHLRSTPSRPGEESSLL